MVTHDLRMRPIEPHEAVCSTCHGTKVVPAETLEEYAARLRELVKQARAERDEMKARFGFTYCAYCGYEIPVDSDESIGDHIRVCDKHPMRQVEAELEQVKSERDALLNEPRIAPHCPPRQAICIHACRECWIKWVKHDEAARAVAGKDGANG